MSEVKVTTGKPKVGGAVFRAPIGTAIPTDATTALAVAFKNLGYISEDGISNENARGTNEIKAWGGDTVLNPQTSKSDKFSMAFLDTKDVEVMKAVYGDSNVTGDLTSGITVKVNAEELTAAVWVIDMVTTDGDPKRICIPDGTVTEVGEITYKDGDAVTFDVTISCVPDTEGNTHYEYLKKKSGE